MRLTALEWYRWAKFGRLAQGLVVGDKGKAWLNEKHTHLFFPAHPHTIAVSAGRYPLKHL